MTDAKLLIDDVLRPAIRLERHLPDPPAVVWQALTEREQLRSWFPCDVVVTGGRWEPGAALTFLFPPEVIDITLAGQPADGIQGRPPLIGSAPRVVRPCSGSHEVARFCWLPSSRRHALEGHDDH
jgi:hypothetical protein